MFNLTELENNYLLNPLHLGSSRPAIYPSEASVKFTDNGFDRVEGKCLREAYYRIKEYKKTEPASIYLNDVASVGKWDEIGLIERWKEMGLWVANNIKFYNIPYVLSGELDCVLRESGTDNLIGYEVKSYYGYAAEKQILGGKRPYFPGAPKYSHLLQASIYAWEFKDKFSEYRIYYLERGNGKRCEFRVGTEVINGRNLIWYEQVPGYSFNGATDQRIYYPFAVEDIYSRIKLLGEYVRKEELPPKDYGIPWSADKVEYFYSKGELAKGKYTDWKKDPEKNPINDFQCSYCFYRSQCAKDEMSSCLQE